MDVYDIIKCILIPIAIGVTAHQYKVMWDLKRDIANKPEEESVRTIIEDKLEALKKVDESSAERITKVEKELVRINEKLDRILELLYKKD